MSHAFSGQRRLVAAAIFISLLVALAAARENASGRLDLGVAATQVVVDFPSPSIVKRRALDQKYGPGNFTMRLASPEARGNIARRSATPTNLNDVRDNPTYTTRQGSVEPCVMRGMPYPPW